MSKMAVFPEHQGKCQNRDFCIFPVFSESTDDCDSESVLQFIFQIEDPTKDRRLTGCNDLHKFFGLIFEPS